MDKAYVKAAFADEVNALIARGITDRTDRMQAVEAVTDAYIESMDGEWPNSAQLERLADYILREELTDRHPDKITRNEYPFMSTWQLDLRHDREYSIDLVENHGVDGKDYRMPSRRHRTAKELRFIDKLAQMKNKRRCAQYREDTVAGPVVTYNLRETGVEFTPEFVDRVGISERFR